MLQLGAGTALAGLVAAKCGAKFVTLTDHAEKHETLTNCLQTVQLNIELNGLEGDNVRVVGLIWGHLNPASLWPCDIMIAADCFYDTKGECVH